MAKREVTGATLDELDDLRSQWDPDDGEFEDNYCLAKIPRQPDDYDGPDRYCLKRSVSPIGSAYRCQFHGGAGETNSQNLDKLAAMTHGMKAARDHLVQDFDEKDLALYDWIIDSYSSAYDLDIESDPSAAYDLHRLAAEIVRAERGRGHLVQEGEITEQEVFDGEGNIVIDDQGEVVTEKSEHYLAKMMHRQDKKLTQLQKELGVSRKERLKRDSTDDAIEAVKSFGELGKAFLDREDKEYDPGDKPWEDDQ